MPPAEEGCYEAVRAAGLSGVPLSTLYYWANTGVVVPSISPVRERLWSYVDLMALRIVSWLRHPKGVDQDRVPASPMRQVREVLDFLDRQGIDLWRQAGDSRSGPLRVDRSGKVWIRHEGGGFVDPAGNTTLDLEADYLDLLAPYGESGAAGPHLLTPRPRLRIVPLKVAGEPHIVGSRITSRSLDALARRGFAPRAIASMYELDEEAVEEALDLERQLAASAQSAA